MIWFDSRKLELQIAQNRLTEKDSFTYLLATAIYGYIIALYSSLTHYSTTHLIIVLAHVAITLVGLPMVFKINCDLDNKDFLKRYLAITWVIRMKLLIWFIFSSLIYYNIEGVKTNKPAQITFIISNSVLTSLLYYALSIRSFKKIKKLIQKNVPSEPMPDSI